MEADRVGRDRRVALVDDHLAVDECKGAQGRYGFVKTIAGERRGEGLAEFLPRFGE